MTHLSRRNGAGGQDDPLRSKDWWERVQMTDLNLTAAGRGDKTHLGLW
jgi:hypothetical protein